MKTLIKSTIYCLAMPFTHVCCENYISGFSTFVLSLSKSGNILFRSMANENCLFSSASIIVTGRRYLPGVYELRVMATVELHANTAHAQHSPLKSVYGKSQLVIGGKLFSSYRTVFELAQGLWDSKTSDLNCSILRGTCLERIIDHISSWGVFMCSIFITSFRKVLTVVIVIPTLTMEEHPCMGVKTPFLSHLQYICCKLITEDGESPQL